MEDNFQEPASTKQVVMKWGLILGLVSVVLTLITYMSGTVNNAIQWLGLIPTIGAIVLAHNEFKKSGDGYMSYGKGLGIGTLLNLVAGVISSVFAYVYLSFVDGSYLDLIKEQQITQMEEQGLSDQQIEQALSFSEFFMSPIFFLIAGIFFAVFFGFVLSLIVSAFTKNNDPTLEI